MKTSISRTVVSFIFLVQYASAAELSNFDPILSQNTLGIFIQAAECLSLKASTSEKKQFVGAHQALAKYKSIDDLYLNPKEMEKLDAMSEHDQKAIRAAIKKYCPYTESLIAESLKEHNRNAQIMLRIALDDLIISYVSVQVLDAQTRDKLFRYEHTPIGITVSPY